MLIREMYRTELQGPFLGHAHLQGAWLGGCRLEGADLRDAQMQGADLVAFQLPQGVIKGGDIQRAALPKGGDLSKHQVGLR